MSLSLPKLQHHLKRRPEDVELAEVFGVKRCGTRGGIQSQKMQNPRRYSVVRRCGTRGDIRWPEDAELAEVFGVKRCRIRGGIRWSEDIELAAVFVGGAEGLETFGGHAEHEIVSEDRVVVLEDGGDLSLGLAFQVKAD